MLRSIYLERNFWRSVLVSAIARASRVSGYPRLSDFKGLAVLQTMPPPPVDADALPPPKEKSKFGKLGMGGKANALSAADGTVAGKIPDAKPKLKHQESHGSAVTALALNPVSAHSMKDGENKTDLKGLKEEDPLRFMTPLRVLEAAQDLGLLYGLIGSVQGLGGPPPGHTTRAAPYRCLWIAAMYAMAPLPANWQVKRLPPEVEGGDKKLVYQKSEQGRLLERDSHPLREAYRQTCARCINHCPKLALKQTPYIAWLLFSIDGKPRCVNMHLAAKKTYKHKQAMSRQLAEKQHRMRGARSHGCSRDPNRPLLAY